MHARPGRLSSPARSLGIGWEPRQCCAREGFDLVVATDEPEIKSCGKMRGACAKSGALESQSGNHRLYDTIVNPPVEMQEAGLKNAPSLMTSTT
jgi:hypothetical protein